MYYIRHYFRDDPEVRDKRDKRGRRGGGNKVLDRPRDNEILRAVVWTPTVA